MCSRKQKCSPRQRANLADAFAANKPLAAKQHLQTPLFGAGGAHGAMAVVLGDEE